MSRVFKQQTNRDSVGILEFPVPTVIHHNPGEPSKAYDPLGRMCRASCLGCLNPTCMRFSPEELRLYDERLNEFPADIDDTICPLNAIIWERGARTPSIVTERCINCGICARRCPIGAIYSKGKAAVIHSGEPEVAFTPVTPESLQKHTMQISALCFPGRGGYKHMGQFVVPNEAAIENLYNRLDAQSTEVQFPNLIIRNLFLVLGNQCIMRRRGDIYFRIDAIIANRPRIGIAEVEFHKDSLESPRAILDDIAVLSSRYGISKTEVEPYIVSLVFPNLRTEYWRVIKDIRDVLGVRIHSLTLGALCMLAWSFVCVPIGAVDFYADVDTPSIRQQIGMLCRTEGLPKSLSHAVLEPKK